jgi:hypothetical protein
MNNNWNQAVDCLLDKIRLNSIMLASKHIKNHLYYLNCSKYFEIPVIILSVFSSSFSVGSEKFMHQETISVVTCAISMMVTILTSTKLYMKITENSSQEQELAIQYKSLALDLFKILSLPKENRGTDGLVYLNKVYSKYTNLIESSQILNNIKKNDKLLSINHALYNDDEGSLSSNESNNSNPILTEENQL